MFEWIQSFFKKKEEKKEDPILIGDKWCLKRTDPWPKNPTIVTILDVKQGWVRYDMGHIFNDERMKEDSFRYCYSRCE